MSSLSPGTLLGGRYELERRLDDDGLVERWAAADRVLARHVIVESLAVEDDAAARQAFIAAAAASARLVHPGIIATYDRGVVGNVAVGGLPFVVTERPPGVPLADLLERQGADGGPSRRHHRRPAGPGPRGRPSAGRHPWGGGAGRRAGE
ncbi:MAG: hypothetical protein ACHQNA_08605 [Acidimicrobiales bacterium]